MVSSWPLYKHDNYYSRTADSGNRAWQSPAHGRLNWNWEKHSERNGIYFAFIDSSEKPNNVLYNTLLLQLLTVQRVYYVLTRRDVAGRCDDCACDALVFIFREFCTFPRGQIHARVLFVRVWTRISTTPINSFKRSRALLKNYSVRLTTSRYAFNRTRFHLHCCLISTRILEITILKYV